MNDVQKKVLKTIYIGQNINKYGILKSDINDEVSINYLIDENMIKYNHWYFDLYITTKKGNNIMKIHINKLIEENLNLIDEEFLKYPKKLISFCINRIVKKTLVYPLTKPVLSDSWEDALLTNSKIWVEWISILTFLEKHGLSIAVHDYSSSSGGEILGLSYIISPEIQTFLVEKYLSSDFSPSHERLLKLYPFFLKVSRILNYTDKDVIKNLYFRLLSECDTSENDVYSIVKDMSKYKITSKYNGIMSDDIPFDILDFKRYLQYLRKYLIDNSASLLIGKKVKLRTYEVVRDYPALSEIKSNLGFLSNKEIGDFYTYVSDLERKIRDFIKIKLGKKWYKRIETNLPIVIKKWEEKKNKEAKWGIKPEDEAINYSDFGDYIQIFTKYDRIFTDGESDLNNVIVHLSQWYVHGRNPIMHARTIDIQKYFITVNANDFLTHWMERKMIDR